MKNKDLKIKFVDELKTDYKIVAAELNLPKLKGQKFNRAKDKEQVRKMSEDYLDR